MITTESVRTWDAVAGLWRTVQVEVTSEPGRRGGKRRATPRRGQPRNTAGLSNDSPLPSWWRDTAYAPATGPAGWADMRTYVPAATMRTHRAAAVMPVIDAGAVIATSPRDRLDI